MKWLDNIKNSEEFREFSHTGIRGILNGSFLTWKFFRRQYLLVGLLVVLSILYINNRYESEKMMKRIGELKREIKDAKYESLTISAELTEISRQSNIEDLLRKKNMQLKTGDRPPIVIK
jgi:hypothetical protein